MHACKVFWVITFETWKTHSTWEFSSFECYYLEDLVGITWYDCICYYREGHAGGYAHAHCLLLVFAKALDILLLKQNLFCLLIWHHTTQQMFANETNLFLNIFNKLQSFVVKKLPESSFTSSPPPPPLQQKSEEEDITYHIVWNHSTQSPTPSWLFENSSTCV